MAKEDAPYVQLATPIPKELHRVRQAAFVQTDTSLMDFVVAALQDKLAKGAGRKWADRSE